MIVVRAAMAAAVAVLLSVVIAGSAGARNPAPTPTQELLPPPGLTPINGPTATPVGPEPAFFNIIPWVNAHNTAREVTAFIGDTLCATGVPIEPPGGALSFFLSIPSEKTAHGCGYEGAVVTFFIDGQKADRTAIWRSGGGVGLERLMIIIIGPRFALLGGLLTTTLRLEEQPIVPYVGGQPCGDARPLRWIGGGPLYTYGVVVYSSEQQAGCGFEGAQITFKILDAQGNVIAVANEKATWHAWDGVAEQQRVDLTFGPTGGIAMPGTGTGSGSTGQATRTLLSLGLASLALIGGAVALAFRRATTR